jgi:hypothetical protein
MGNVWGQGGDSFGESGEFFDFDVSVGDAECNGGIGTITVTVYPHYPNVPGTNGTYRLIVEDESGEYYRAFNNLTGERTISVPDPKASIYYIRAEQAGTNNLDWILNDIIIYEPSPIVAKDAKVASDKCEDRTITATVTGGNYGAGTKYRYKLINTTTGVVYEGNNFF